MSVVRVLFVCMGNICRSPMAEGVFRKLVEEAGCRGWFEIDSAGTRDYNVGQSPDARAISTVAQRGINIGGRRGRQVTARDIELFDVILAMDNENYADLLAICPPGLEQKIRLLMDYAPQRSEREVSDPYAGGDIGFDRVFDMLEEAASGLLRELRNQN
jgi:protein-tyrosine phosphatase